MQYKPPVPESIRLALLISSLYPGGGKKASISSQACPASLGGETEGRHEYTYPAGQSYVRVDCETADTVYEGGLDKRSSLDSVQQALFAAHLTGTTLAVVISNTDGKIGRYEHRIKVACGRAGVAFSACPALPRRHVRFFSMLLYSINCAFKKF